MQLYVTMSPYDRASLSEGRKAVKHWHAQHPAGAILVVLEGHAVISSGEVLWRNTARTGRKESYGYIPDVCRLTSTANQISQQNQIVAKVLGQDIFCNLLTENRLGLRGMIALVCGYAYHTEKSRESILNLVQK